MQSFTIKRLGHQADGIADGPNGDIYVPFTLPGEVVQGVLSGDRLTDMRVLTSSPDRIKPPCVHFKTCGGCALQHVSDAFLATWKIEVVKTALTAQGLSARFLPIETSPPQSRRRATFSARRTKKGTMVGFHGRASDSLVEISGCQLLHPDLIAGLPAFAAITRIGATRSASISLAVTQSENGLDVDVKQAKPTDGPMLMELGALTERLKLARLSWNGETIASRIAPTQRFQTATVTPPPDAFLQATAHGQAALTKAVLAAIGPAKRVADLFAGCGTFTLPLAKLAEVHAVESDAAALAALDVGWRKAVGLKTITTQTRDLFRRPLEPSELDRFDAVVLDPPRAGAKAQVEALATSKVPCIAAVSCNPVTFARDAATLIAGGYRLDWVQVVDQFRWSPHVELVGSFIRA
jgi:23S rRNA (uracil1939-C5)-methyltransferase